MAMPKEREEAARVFGAGAEAPAATFEPDEELAQAEEAVAVVAAPAPTKGPTAEQLTAIQVRAPVWWRLSGQKMSCKLSSRSKLLASPWLYGLTGWAYGQALAMSMDLAWPRR
jgi:hypothetical protein